VKERIARSVFWIVWSRGVIQTLSFLSTLLVARLLSPSDYGIMAAAGVWTSTIFLLTELGLGAAVIQFRDLQEEELNACFWFTVTAATGAYGVLYLAAPWIATWFGMPMLSSILRVLGLNLLLAAFRIVPESLLRKRLELDKLAKGEILATMLGIPVVIGLAMAGAGVWALVSVSLFMPVVSTISAYWFVRWWPGMRMGSARLGDLIRFSSATLGTRLCASAYQQADAVVLGKMAGDVTLGFFSMAKQLALLPSEKVSTVVNQLASPVMAELQADCDAMRATFLRGIRLVVYITAPMCVGMALVAEDLVWVTLTKKWLSAVPLLQVLCFYALIRSLDVLMPPVLFAKYRAAFLFWYALGLLIIMPIAFWAGAALMGALGVALAWVLVYPVIMVRMAREALRELEIGWKTLWRQVWPAMWVTLVMAGVVIAIRWVMPGSDFVERVMRLALTSGIGALVYGFGIFWMNDLVVGELAEVAGWILRPRQPISLRNNE